MSKLLTEVLSYDAHTGELRWRQRMGSRAAKGALAGSINDAGYVVINTQGRFQYAHRIAWFITYGSYPAKDIDQVNGDKSDNRISNLREASRSQNIANSKRRSLVGSSFDKKEGKWRAYIKKDYRQIFLGYFATAGKAHEAYVEAAPKYFGEFSRV